MGCHLSRIQSRHPRYGRVCQDEEAVARGVDAAYDENTSILSYNDENSLSCVLSIAYITTPPTTTSSIAN